MTTFQRICVFCGSNPGRRESYRAAAEATAVGLVAHGIGLVYGGGSVGLMGAVADAMLAAGGEVIGVIPRHLFEREIAHHGVDLRIVESMHERKTLMYDLSDAFIALPGGLGTFEELFETLTWSQLGLHAKPVGLLDVDGYFRSLVDFLDHATAEGMIRAEHRRLLVEACEPHGLLAAMAAWQPTKIDKWITDAER